MNWYKEKRSNDTHEPLTDSMARLFKKTLGAEARLGYLGHVLAVNRNGVVIDVRLKQATGKAEREAALEIISGGKYSCRSPRRLISRFRGNHLVIFCALR